MERYKQYFTGIVLLMTVVVSLVFINARTLKAEKNDDFLQKKEPVATGTVMDDFQTKMESLMSKPFFQDPSLDNLRGFGMFDQNLNERLNQMFKGLNLPMGLNNTASPFDLSAGKDNIQADIREAGDKLIVNIDLPGHEKSSIDLQLKDNCLVISSERSETSSSKDDKNKVYRSEVSYGKFSRIIELPRKVIEDKISATFNNGVLTVTAPIDTAPPVPESGHKIQIN